METLMTNVGTVDKIIRIILGLIIFVSFFAMQSWFWLAGVAVIVTGLLDFCPIYKVLGINTCKAPEKWWK